MNLPNRDTDSVGIISEYRSFLKSSKYSTPTVKNYVSDLRHLISWYTKNFGEFKLSSLTGKNFASYRSFLSKEFIDKPSIFTRRISSLRNFVSWADKQGLLKEEILKSISKSERLEVFPTPFV